MSERLVVVGGDAGGMTAASQARRRVPDADQLEIVAFERGELTSYSACGVPYFVGDVVHEYEDLVARSPEEHRKRGIDVRIRHEVVAIDLARRSVRVRDLDGGAEDDHGFDQLVLGTGAVPVRPPLDGIDAAGVFGVQTLADGIAVRRAVDDDKPARAVVVGSGYVGLEMAEAMVQRGIEVALVEVFEQPMHTLDIDMGALVADALRAVGVDLYLGEPATGFETAGGRVKAVVTEQRSLPCDLVVLGLGVKPNNTLARDAGIGLGDTGGIWTDETMATTADGVWAAGDCVETWHRVSHRPVAIALGTHANKQGRVVGMNVTGGEATFPGVIGTAVTKVCAYEVARTGLTERETAEVGIDSVAATIEATTRAGYFPGAEQIKVKLVAGQGTGRLLGGQIVGKEGAAKRVDVLAAAIWNGMTAEELVGLDVGYAPPFSPLWDPVLVAARKLTDEVGG
ncbi:MAG TPA: FAD-dependent oxidoreductase [Acidimicrobiia bacterium]|nr:FAD-dependent oxidoreductase [Acidimicrobiia bacterium]